MTSRRPANSNNNDTDARIEELQRLIEELQRRGDSAQPATAASRTEGTKVRGPKPFDGTDPALLYAFIIHVQLVLETRASEFSTERSKIVYAATYLEGGALMWVYPLLNMTDPPDYMTDFALFVKELEQTFGVPVSLIEEQLRQLQQTGTVYQYSMDFRRFAGRVSWNDASLVSQFYSGLKHQIKVELIRVGRPETLEQLTAKAIALDNLQQQSRKQLGPRFQPQDQPPMDHSSRVSPATKRLTDQQREFRRKNNRCMYCGDAGHFVTNCPARPPGPPRPARISAAALLATEPQGNDSTQSQ